MCVFLIIKKKGKSAVNMACAQYSELISSAGYNSLAGCTVGQDLIYHVLIFPDVNHGGGNITSIH